MTSAKLNRRGQGATIPHSSRSIVHVRHPHSESRPLRRYAAIEIGAFVDNSKVNADIFLGRVRALLGEKYGAVAGGTVRKLAPKDDLSAAELMQLGDYDAVIQGFGD
jgi:hypothetical protein